MERIIKDNKLSVIPEVLIFDMDNTLIDLKESNRLTYIQMYKALNRSFCDDKFNKIYCLEHEYWQKVNTNKIIIPKEHNTSFEEIQTYIRYHWIENVWQVPYDEAPKIYKLYCEIIRDNIVPIQNVEEVIKYLSSKYTLIIASNGDESLIEHKLKAANIDNCFKCIICGHEIKAFKPEVKFFNNLMKQINYHNISKMIMIGDDISTDVQGAINAGITPIWYNIRNEIVVNHDLNKHITIKELQDLKEIL
ncbi:MAG: HAD family hydrolase [Clostridia bacterium]|nr:HAD family hydrolase [Clostridia bacterium]